jgi:AraC-like DNA-binding protein
MTKRAPVLSPAVTELFARVRDPRDVLGPIAVLPGVMFFIKDANYRYVAMSPAIREAVGLSADDDPAGRTDFDLFPPLIAASFRANDRLVIEEGQTLLDEVHVVVARNRGTQLAYSSKWPIRGDDGAIVGLVGTNRPHESSGGGDVGDAASRMLPAITRMVRDYAMRLPIGELAAACRLSPSRFMWLFREQMGVTAHQFLEKVRITEAGRLLRTTRLPIADVAAACGFYDHSAFVKRFRRHTGLAPLAYRKSGHARLEGSLAKVVDRPTASE